MKISKAKLKKLIESYLYEQEEDDTAVEDEPAEDAAAEDEPAGDEEEMDTSDGEETEEDSEIKWEDAGFQIEVDGTEKDISFYEDEQTGKVNYKVDGDELGGRTTANFATIGNLATLSDDPMVQKAGEMLSKIETGMKDKDLSSIKRIVKQKMKTERSPLSIKDIRKAIQARE
jgi:hypothetical protein